MRQSAAEIYCLAYRPSGAEVLGTDPIPNRAAGVQEPVGLDTQAPKHRAEEAELAFGEEGRVG